MFFHSSLNSKFVLKCNYKLWKENDFLILLFIIFPFSYLVFFFFLELIEVLIKFPLL